MLHATGFADFVNCLQRSPLSFTYLKLPRSQV